MGEGSIFGESEGPQYRSATARAPKSSSGDDEQSVRRKSSLTERLQMDFSSSTSKGKACTLLTMNKKLCVKLCEMYPQFEVRAERQRSNFKVLGAKSMRVQKKWAREHKLKQKEVEREDLAGRRASVEQAGFSGRRASMPTAASARRASTSTHDDEAFAASKRERRKTVRRSSTNF